MNPFPMQKSPRPKLPLDEIAALLGLCLWSSVMAAREGLHPEAALFRHGASLLLEQAEEHEGRAGS